MGKKRQDKGKVLFLKRLSFVSLVLFLIILLLTGTSDFILGKTRIFSTLQDAVKDAIFARQEGISGERVLFGPGECTNISQYNITWTFDKSYECGQFVNGDWWVLGPVNIVNITPAPADVWQDVVCTGGTAGFYKMHGSMINPNQTNTQSYDSRAPSIWNESTWINAPSITIPLIIQKNSSLISAISWLATDAGHPLCAGSNRPNMFRPTVRSAAILTVLSSAPPADALRPPYMGDEKTIIRKSDINFSLIPRLSTSGFTSLRDDFYDDVRNYIQRPWIDHVTGDGAWIMDTLHPSENMPNYGGDMANRISRVGVLILSDIDTNRKENFTIQMVQLGIDNYEIFKFEGDWGEVGGAIGVGRKLPILFAGILTNNSLMKSLINPNDDYVFQEDCSIFYVQQSDIDRFPYNPSINYNWEGTSGPEILPVWNGWSQDDLNKPDWSQRHCNLSENDNLKRGYQSLASPSAPGIALVLLSLESKESWNNSLFFDYVDYWIVRPELWSNDIDAYKRDVYGYAGTGNGFMTDMWNTYRNNYGCFYSSMNPITHTRIYSCSNVILDCKDVSSCSDYSTQRARDYDPCQIGPCGSVASACGNGICNATAGENCSTCSLDCGACVDTTAPVISNVQNSSITNQSAIISWNTDENTNGRIYYGLSAVNLNLNAVDGNYLLSHIINLNNLGENSIYYYKVESCDASGNCANSSIYNFRTLVTSLPGSFEINMGRIIGAGAAEGTVELLEGTIKNVVFNFSVDGNVADINDATASARFSKSGVDRTNSSCRLAYSEANKRVYKCTIGMQFYDEAGDWNILANISDTFGNVKVNNTKRISVGTLMGISLNSLSAGFSNANPGNSDILAQGMPLIVTNKGNYESLIAILGHNLHGAVRSGEYINVNNFMAGTGAGVCSTGTALANGTAVAVSGSLLTRGISSTKDIYYCMKNVPSVSSQKYSTLLLFGWKISLS